jgi:hypothetical protein
MTSTMPLPSAQTPITCALTTSHVSSHLTTPTSVITAQLTCVDTSLITFLMLSQKVTATWMKEKFHIDTWKYQGRGGVMS